MDKDWINWIIYRFAPVAGEIALAAFALAIGLYVLIKTIF